jgi:hypothetical protein
VDHLWYRFVPEPAAPLPEGNRSHSDDVCSDVAKVGKDIPSPYCPRGGKMGSSRRQFGTWMRFGCQGNPSTGGSLAAEGNDTPDQ